MQFDLLNLYKKNCLGDSSAIKALVNKISVYEKLLKKYVDKLDLILNSSENNTNTNNIAKTKNEVIEEIDSIKLYLNLFGKTLAIIDTSYKHTDIQVDRKLRKYTSIFEQKSHLDIQNYSLDHLTVQELLALVTPQKFNINICYQLRERGVSDFEILEKVLSLLDDWSLD